MSSMKAKTLIRGREGFTLIELLIVITIIGIIAAIALPKFNQVRNRAHFKAMMSDMRNLQSQQELYFAKPANNFSYATDISFLFPMFETSQGVTIEITEAGSTGWAATASHGSMIATSICAVYQGQVVTPPAPATTAGIVTCTGE
jgi:type IV pilus assembly protein PilA